MKQNYQDHKIRLNQRQWLSLVIFFTGFMFLLLVITGKIQNREPDSQPTEPSASPQLVKIDFGDWQLSQKHGVWSSSDPRLSKAQAQQTGELWQSLLSTRITLQNRTESKGQTILLYLAGQPAPIVVKIAKDRQQGYIQLVNQKVSLEISLIDYDHYSPLNH